MFESEEVKAGYWGRISETYDRKLERIFGKDLRRNLARILEKEHNLGNVIEFGCGTGYFTRVIARNASHVIATDASPEMVRVAKERLRGIDNISFQVENVEATALPSEAFDTALMANMLHTLDDPQKALKQCYRVLMKGGTLLVINYTEDGMSRVERTLMFFRFALNFGIPPRGNWPITSERLRSWIEAAGFEIEKMDLIEGKLNTFYVKAKK